MDCWRRRWQKLDLGCSLRCTPEIFTDYFLCHRCSLESRWISIGSQWLTEIGNMGLEPCPDNFSRGFCGVSVCRLEPRQFKTCCCARYRAKRKFIKSA